MKIRDIVTCGASVLLLWTYPYKPSYSDEILTLSTETINLKNKDSKHIFVFERGGISVEKGPSLISDHPVYISNLGVFVSKSDHAIFLEKGAHKTTILNNGLISGEKSGIFGEKGAHIIIKNGVNKEKNGNYEKSVILGKSGAIRVDSIDLVNQGVICNESLDSPAIVVGKDSSNDGVTNIIQNSGTIRNTAANNRRAIEFHEGHNILELKTGSEILGAVVASGTRALTKNEAILSGNGLLRTLINFDRLKVYADPMGWIIHNGEIKDSIILFSGSTIVTNGLGADGSKTIIMPNARLGGAFYSSDTVSIFGDVVNKGGTLTGNSKNGGGAVHLTIHGNYTGTEGSLYVARIYKNHYEEDAHDTLKIKKGADFSQTDLQIKVGSTLFHNHLFRSDNSYHIVEGIDRGFRRIVNFDYLFFRFPTITEQGVLNLSFKNKNTPFAVDGLKANEHVMAQWLSEQYNTLLADPFITADKTDVLNTFLSASSAQGHQVLNGGNAQIYGDVGESVQNDLTFILNGVHTRLGGLKRGLSPWAYAMYGGQKMQGSSQRESFSQNSSRAIFGLEYVSERYKNQGLGIILAPSVDFMRVRNIGQRAQIQHISTGVYHIFYPSFYPLIFSTSALYTYYWGEVTRQSDFPEPNVAKGDVSGHMGIVSSQVQWPLVKVLPLVKTVTITPFTRLDAAFLHQNQTQEQKNFTSIVVEPQNRTRFTFMLGSQFEKYLFIRKSLLTLSVQTAWMHTFASKNTLQHTLPTYNLTPTSAQVSSYFTSRDQDVAVLGASVRSAAVSFLSLAVSAHSIIGPSSIEGSLGLEALARF